MAPACRAGISFPAVTGEIGVSLLDFGARRLAKFAGKLMLVSLPWHRVMEVISALDHGVGRTREEGEQGVDRPIDDSGPIRKV
jgi:uncharacterized protein (DUF169 family)